jgi:PIN domain nuclease of toxin-antitoxin system
MKLLLDTHLLLWAATEPKKLSQDTAALLTDPRNELIFSVVSIWEIAIKKSRGYADFTVDPRVIRRGMLYNGYEELLIQSDHAVAVADLPWLHKDPFDRLLVAQATAEGILLLTSDRQVADYPGPIRLV